LGGVIKRGVVFLQIAMGLRGPCCELSVYLSFGVGVNQELFDCCPDDVDAISWMAGIRGMLISLV